MPEKEEGQETKEGLKEGIREEAKEVEGIEDRLNDEYAIMQFGTLGFTGRLPDKLVETYLSFKKRKDTLMPGRLSPEGFATVILLSGE